MTTNKAIIVLQENSGKTVFDDSLPTDLRSPINAMIDGLAETFEDVKMTLQGSGRYDVVHLLTDNACTRAKLLDCLVDETKKNRTIDLIILGHGVPEKLLLKTPPHLEGDIGSRSIKELLTDAQGRGVTKLNLRMVYMCNCYGASVNDDWLEIGAKVSIGSRERDMMPEPMTTFFVHNWLAGETAKDAARNAYEASISFYLPLYPPTPKTKYKTVEVSYPCPTRKDPFKKCKKSVQVPDGVEFVPHTYVRETELIVDGDGNTRL
ncbi:hypothetical protein ACE1B6_10900 [Aerosakkonemataceae cyanobacterium BLCC-F154]|uniref:Uncharacterized protein n=1 Tax=Floridaenema fluviatile BLCC-F154 TaxID=3153640 RepID=A0ABV4YAB0_9CYAN